MQRTERSLHRIIGAVLADPTVVVQRFDNRGIIDQSG